MWAGQVKPWLRHRIGLHIISLAGLAAGSTHTTSCKPL